MSPCTQKLILACLLSFHSGAASLHPSRTTHTKREHHGHSSQLVELCKHHKPTDSDFDKEVDYKHNFLSYFIHNTNCMCLNMIPISFQPPLAQGQGARSSIRDPVGYILCTSLLVHNYPNTFATVLCRFSLTY